MSALAIQTNNYVNEVRASTGRWPEFQDVCNAMECSIEVALRAIATVQRFWSN